MSNALHRHLSHAVFVFGLSAIFWVALGSEFGIGVGMAGAAIIAFRTQRARSRDATRRKALGALAPTLGLTAVTSDVDDVLTGTDLRGQAASSLTALKGTRGGREIWIVDRRFFTHGMGFNPFLAANGEWTEIRIRLQPGQLPPFRLEPKEPLLPNREGVIRGTQLLLDRAGAYGHPPGVPDTFLLLEPEAATAKASGFFSSQETRALLEAHPGWHLHQDPEGWLTLFKRQSPKGRLQNSDVPCFVEPSEIPAYLSQAESLCEELLKVSSTRA